jgi:hypothetical protein
MPGDLPEQMSRVRDRMFIAEDLAMHLLQTTYTGTPQHAQIRLDFDLVGLCHSAFSNCQLLFMKARNG